MMKHILKIIKLTSKPEKQKDWKLKLTSSYNRSLDLNEERIKELSGNYLRQQKRDKMWKMS